MFKSHGFYFLFQFLLLFFFFRKMLYNKELFYISDQFDVQHAFIIFLCDIWIFAHNKCFFFNVYITIRENEIFISLTLFDIIISYMWTVFPNFYFLLMIKFWWIRYFYIWQVKCKLPLTNLRSMFSECLNCFLSNKFNIGLIFGAYRHP